MSYGNYEYDAVNELENGPFKYMIISNPINEDWLALEKEQIFENIKEINEKNEEYINNQIMKIENIEQYIRNFIINLGESFPREGGKCKYFCIPIPQNSTCELVVMIMVDNNGDCFFFSNDKEYLQFLAEKGII